MRHALAIVTALLLGSGCSSPAASPRPPSLEPPVASTSEPTSRVTESIPATPSEAADARPSLAPPKSGEEIDLNYNDCEVLAETYERVWLRDAREKDGPPPANVDRETVESNLVEAAASARASWSRACTSVVGTRVLRRNVVCASRAKSLQQFNDCYDGRAP
jgi:hypothetical protein